MAHASIDAAVGRHGPVRLPLPLNASQHRILQRTACQSLRGEVAAPQGLGVMRTHHKAAHIVQNTSTHSSRAVRLDSCRFRRGTFSTHKLHVCSRLRGTGESKGKKQRTVRCNSGSVSAGGDSGSLDITIEVLGQRVAVEREAETGKWQGDRPMILPVLLREKKPEHFVKAAEGLLKMARLQNYFPSLLLVFLGAWMASGHDTAVLLRPKVWITAVCSALIAVASMLANDVFDFRSGTDQANERDTPLMTGEVAPDDAELAAGCLYGAAVIGICCLEPMTLRLLVGGAAVATYIYTPFLKRLLVVKNVIVAAIIASSILAGGLVAGGTAGVARTGQVSLFFFLCILCREILMDVGDMVGDKAAGVRTVAVCFGRRVGTAAAGVALAAANFVLIGLLAKTQAVAAAGTLLLLPLHARIFQVLQGGSEFTADRLSVLRGIVDQSMLYIGGSVLLLATTV